MACLAGREACPRQQKGRDLHRRFLAGKFVMPRRDVLRQHLVRAGLAKPYWKRSGCGVMGPRQTCGGEGADELPAIEEGAHV